MTRRLPKYAKRDWIINTLDLETDECVNWPFGVDRDGYPEINASVFGSSRVNRVICILAHGNPVDPMQHAAHRCPQNRLCCNKRHIRWASPAENENDKYLHGTVAYGVRNGNAKYTSDEVIQIKNLLSNGTPQRVIAQSLGVTQAIVGAISSGRVRK